MSADSAPATTTAFTQAPFVAWPQPGTSNERNMTPVGEEKNDLCASRPAASVSAAKTGGAPAVVSAEVWAPAGSASTAASATAARSGGNGWESNPPRTGEPPDKRI